MFKLVGLSLCQSPAKMAEPIEVLFGMVNWVGSETLLLVVASAAREFISPRAVDSASCPVTDPGNHWIGVRTSATCQMHEVFTCGSDGVLRQITVTTCFALL